MSVKLLKNVTNGGCFLSNIHQSETYIYKEISLSECFLVIHHFSALIDLPVFQLHNLNRGPVIYIVQSQNVMNKHF